MYEFCDNPEVNKRMNDQVRRLVEDVIDGQDMNVRYSSYKSIMRRVVKETIFHLVSNYNVED